MLNSKIGIIGAGPFGLAISSLISNYNNCKVNIYDKLKTEDEIKKHYKEIFNSTYKDEKIIICKNFEQIIKGSKILFVAIPTFAISSFCKDFLKIKSHRNPILIFVSKGFIFENCKMELISQFVKNNLNEYDFDKLMYLGGPTIHSDVFENNNNYYFNLASFGNNSNNLFLSQVFNLIPKNKVFHTKDLIGLEISMCMKNVYAILFNYEKETKNNFDKENEIEECLFEMYNFGLVFGEVEKKTFKTVGRDDFIITIEKGRNGKIGTQLGKGEIKKGEGLNTCLKNTNYTPEGIYILEKLKILIENDEGKFSNLKKIKKLIRIIF